MFFGFARGAFGALLSTAKLLRGGKHFLGPERARPYVTGQAVTVVTGTLTFLYVCTLIPLSTAIAIGSASPVFTVIFARIFIDEPLGVIRITCMITVIGGAFLVARPHFVFKDDESNSTREWGYVMVICADMLWGFGTMCSRAAMRIHDTQMEMLWQYFSLTALGAVGASLIIPGQEFRRPNSMLEYMGLAYACVMGYLIRWWDIYSAKHLEAGTVSVFMGTQIAFGYSYEVLIFNTMAHTTSIVGAVIMWIGIVVLSISRVPICTLCLFRKDKHEREYGSMGTTDAENKERQEESTKYDHDEERVHLIKQ